MIRYVKVGRPSDLSVEIMPTFRLTFTPAIITTSYYYQLNNNAPTLPRSACCAARGGMLAVRLQRVQRPSCLSTGLQLIFFDVALLTPCSMK